ncbi:hypothetical protein [Chondrinema litorale]|uniref:hypothetical protein n=1 Tax=Chondrinema litorale TaxID=2994555 RepID=UPI002543691E|nr:hypothetical protein [Chondrinema litorale]UZR98005.1 hypothetical protein OQ292_28695 [Chondrinema litorale]
MHYLIILLLFFCSLTASAQKRKRRGDLSMSYMDWVDVSKYKGKFIIEFVPVTILSIIRTKDGQLVQEKFYKGYMVNYQTEKGKDIGIRGLNIEDENTGELTYYEIGVRGGLFLEKVQNDQMFLKAPDVMIDEKKHNHIYICTIEK